MKSLLTWAVRNTPAMNTLLVGAMVIGVVSAVNLRREVFPEFALEIVLVTVPYPGASPAEVEEGICQKVEEAVSGIAGIKKMYSVAGESAGSVILELEASANPAKVLDEVRAEVDRIPSFPELAEDPVIKQITLRREAITVGLLGPNSDDPKAEIALRELAEEIRDEMLQLPSVSQVSLMGTKPYEISVEISESTLRRYGLTLQQVAQVLRMQNIELPAGTMKTSSQEILLRGKNKYLTGKEIAELPVIMRPDGSVLTVGDLGTVRDGFADLSTISLINGRPGIALLVSKTQSEDLIAITREVREYLAQKKLPPGYELITWQDISVHVKDRLNLLLRNGAQGLVIVFVVLAVFLELRLAFWVALGIPVSMLGACAVLLSMGQTLNMLSMFAFLMALGILVDDGIVVGENVYEHRQRGKSYLRAAIDGTYEVLPSVFASVMTTIIAFVPLLFVPGVMGKFIAIMPIGVITMLTISLLEVFFVLPCHLAHDEEKDVPPEKLRLRRRLMWIWRFITFGLLIAVFGWARGAGDSQISFELRMTVFVVIAVIALLSNFGVAWQKLLQFSRVVNEKADAGMQWVIDRLYTPVLKSALRHPMVTVGTAVAVLLISIGFVRSGIVPFVSFPKMDSPTINAKIYYPDGTPVQVTAEAVEIMEKAILDIDKEWAEKHGGRHLIVATHRLVGDLVADALRIGNELPSGSHSGQVEVELVEPDKRELHSEEIIKLWRTRAEAMGNYFPGAESVEFAAQAMGPGGKSIEFRLTAVPRDMEVLEKAVEECKEYLASKRGVYNIQDDSRPGKWEFQIRVKDQAKALGITTTDIARTIRSAYYGEEVMRLQRGRHEVKLMVRYPEEERRSLHRFEDIRIRVGERMLPITEVADVKVERGYSQINRLGQRRSIAITADVDENVGNSAKIIAEMKSKFLPELLRRTEYRGLGVSWEGMQQQTQESISGLIRGLLIALVAMFALLTMEFRSYTQPIIIMAVIPFGMVGAIFGHYLLGLQVTLFSLFGIVALTGVVVNDSIVLIDFINHRVRAGVPVFQALVDSGRSRFRPVFLTSVTTVGGLGPIMFEKSFQAQVLIPMAASLAFGLMATTVLVLLLAPTFYLLYSQVVTIEVEQEEVEKALTSGLISEEGKLANGKARESEEETLNGDEERTEEASVDSAA
ncbi:hypothetical protein JCM19992_22350 [Thermostilla marina]